MPLGREPSDPRGGRPRDDAEFLEGVFAGDAGQRAPLPDGRMDPVERLATEGRIAQEPHEMRIGGEVGAVGMVGREHQPPRVGSREKPFQADRPLPGMHETLLAVADRQHTAASLEMQVVRHPGHAGGMGQVLGCGGVARHGHGVAEEHLPHVEREFRVHVEPVDDRSDARTKCVWIEIAAGVAVELHMREMCRDAVECVHCLQQRPPVARQAEVGRVDVERVRQSKRLHHPGQSFQERPAGERHARQRRVEIAVVAAATMFPERRAARIGNLYGPAPTCLHRVCDEPLHLAVALCVMGTVEGRQDFGVIRREQVDALVEDGKVGELHVSHTGGGRGDRRIEHGRVAERRVEGARGVDRGHRGGRAAGELRGDAATRIHLRAGHVAVQVDAPWHHDPAAGIDPSEGLRVGRPGDDPAVLHPDVVDDAITPMQGIVDRATREDESMRFGNGAAGLAGGVGGHAHGRPPATGTVSDCRTAPVRSTISSRICGSVACW